MTRCHPANDPSLPFCDHHHAACALLAALSDAGNLYPSYDDELDPSERNELNEYPYQPDAGDFDLEEDQADEPDDEMITTHFTDGFVPTLSEREYRLLLDCLCYAADPYGAPGHLYKLLIAKLGQSIPAFRLTAN